MSRNINSIRTTAAKLCTFDIWSSRFLLLYYKSNYAIIIVVRQTHRRKMARQLAALKLCTPHSLERNDTEECRWIVLHCVSLVFTSCNSLVADFSPFHCKNECTTTFAVWCIFYLSFCSNWNDRERNTNDFAFIWRSCRDFASRWSKPCDWKWVSIVSQTHRYVNHAKKSQLIWD